jgi:hypothetical protein
MPTMLEPPVKGMVMEGVDFNSVLSIAAGAVTIICSINFDRKTGSVIGDTCLLLVKFSGLKEEQLLTKIVTTIAGNILLTITSFF